MVKRLNIAFSDEEHSRLKTAKQDLALSLGLKRISWENYFLHITGVKDSRSE